MIREIVFPTQAVMAGLAGFPAALRASYLALRGGLKRSATRAGLWIACLRVARPPWSAEDQKTVRGIVFLMHPLPRHWPDCLVTGARPARLAACLAARLAACLAACLAARLAACLASRLAACLASRLAACLASIDPSSGMSISSTRAVISPEAGDAGEDVEAGLELGRGGHKLVAFGVDCGDLRGDLLEMLAGLAFQKGQGQPLGAVQCCGAILDHGATCPKKFFQDINSLVFKRGQLRLQARRHPRQHS